MEKVKLKELINRLKSAKKKSANNVYYERTLSIKETGNEFIFKTESQW